MSDTPEFKDWLHREFPQGASEFEDPVSRRHFVKIMSASFALAGLGLMAAGCRRPEAELVPFSKAPDDLYDYGMPQFFATAMPTRTGAVPLVVKSYGGRPIKIEGNTLYPGGNGGTDRYAQASILNLYDPDRAQRFTCGGKTASREDALKALDELSQKFTANQGQGLAFLAESSTSPSRTRLQKVIAQKFPNSQWFTYDAIDSGIHQRAATQAFGQPVRPVFHFDRAKVVLSLDCDFLGGEDGAHNYIAGFAKGRKPESGGLNRLYAVESLFTLTGLNADHRLRVAASLIGQVAAAISAQLSGATTSLPAGIDAKWISECTKDLIANRGNVLVVAGQRQPIEVHLLAHFINSALGAIGNTVELIPAGDFTGFNADGRVYRPTDNTVANAAGGTFRELALALNAGTIKTLAILGGNPAYKLNWSQKPETVVRLGYYEDETFPACDWHFPLAHYLESWGDAQGDAKNLLRKTTQRDVLFIPIQPLIQPLFGGLTELEFFARLAGESETSPYEIVRKTFVDIGWEITPAQVEESWKRFLFNGFQPDSEEGPG